MAARSPFLTDLGLAIRHRREDQRLSQEELGLQTGIHRNYIGGIERGERNPSIAKIDVLAQALDIRPSELLARAGH
ncbi:MAG: helix-turn-helix transcriptional regulator [Solirubrobacterales bacterium]|nr:helix-turn-helix transcriptional regulator [Solirubrobacterales bacterium]